MTTVAFAGLGLLLLTHVLTLDDIAEQGETLATFLWLAVLFALSGQLNELGFMGYVGEKLTAGLGGLPWQAAYVALIVHLDVGLRGGVPAPLMAFGLLFASSYFSVITPQEGSQNAIFAASWYLTQRELHRAGLMTTAFFLAVFLAVGTPWIRLVARWAAELRVPAKALVRAGRCDRAGDPRHPSEVTSAGHGV